MQQATIMLALGGDVGNTIPKYEVTPAEVAVLQQIHGNESVTEIDIYDAPIARTSRAERERLLRNYGKPTPNGDFRCEPIEHLFPGVAARVFDTFEELDLDDMFFKPKPQKAAPKATPAQDDKANEELGAVDYSKMTKVQLVTLAEKRGITISSGDKKPELVDALETADLQAAQDADEDDEIGEIPGGDQNLFQ